MNTTTTQTIIRLNGDTFRHRDALRANGWTWNGNDWQHAFSSDMARETSSQTVTALYGWLLATVGQVRRADLRIALA
jgi:hypothetical protein